MLHDIKYCKEQLKKGKKLRRPCWYDAIYWFLDQSGGVSELALNNKYGETEYFFFIDWDDLSAEDWEIV